MTGRYCPKCRAIWCHPSAYCEHLRVDGYAQDMRLYVDAVRREAEAIAQAVEGIDRTALSSPELAAIADRMEQRSSELLDITDTAATTIERLQRGLS